MMQRPCLQRHPEPKPGECKACWNWCYDRRFRVLWGGNPEEVPNGDPRDAPVPPPSLLRKVVNLAQAVTQQVAQGLPAVEEGEQAARLAVCRDCPQYLAASDSCRVCGCRVTAKARWGSQDCPQGRWPPLAKLPMDGAG